MGLQAECTARFGKQASEGKARLDSDNLVFRGAFRVAIRLKEVASAEARDGKLKVRFPEGTVTLDLGPIAEKWATRIRNPRSLMDKLGIQPGQRVVVLGVRDKAFWKQLAERRPRVSRALSRKALDGADPADIIVVEIEKRDELAQLAQLRELIQKNGAIWVIRPKGTREINDFDVMAGAKAAGLVDVKVASFSPTHTAEKLVIPVNRR